MDIPIDYIFNLAKDRTLKIPVELKVVFLCGVLFGRDDENDKRSVLKTYLQKSSTHHPVILEEHFTIKDYEDIGVRNLHDLETLVGCFSDAIIIIHESISTGAELGMLASNRAVASKLLVLHPDTNSVEERKISSFIELAFYGKDPVLSKDNAVTFHPALAKNYETNDRYIYHTTFPNNLNLASHTRDGIDAFLGKPDIQPMSAITFSETLYERPSTHKPDVVDYCVKDETLNVYVSPMAMRCLLFSLLSLESARSCIEGSRSISVALSALEDELNKLILATLRTKLGLELNKIKVNMKGLELSTYQDGSTNDYRKTIGLFMYLLKAMGYLSAEDNKKFKFTRLFTSIRNQFSETIIIAKKTAFAKRLQEEDVK
jgi:hypothetical protein